MTSFIRAPIFIYNRRIQMVVYDFKGGIIFSSPSLSRIELASSVTVFRTLWCDIKNIEKVRVGRRERRALTKVAFDPIVPSPSLYTAHWETLAPEARSRSRSSTPLCRLRIAVHSICLDKPFGGLPSCQYGPRDFPFHKIRSRTSSKVHRVDAKKILHCDLTFKINFLFPVIRRI